MRLSDLCIFDKITIQCHDNPDADAIASGYGLFCYFQSKGKEVRLVYSGKNKIQKSNLKLMVEKLSLPIEYISVAKKETVLVEGLLITVDCQFGAGNVTGLSSEHVAIIDHHQIDNNPVPLSLINPNMGSCSTLVWKLLKAEGYPVDKNEILGTALYYGLYTDTNQFSELYNPLDMDMREAVKIDKTLITLFKNSNLSLKELEIAGIAMIRYNYNEEYGFAVIKSQPCDPNLLGLISDFLLQVDTINACVVFNESRDGYKFSVRSCIKEVNASELAVYLADGMGSGGGHYEKAGGFINLRQYDKKHPTLHTEAYFNNRMAEYFDSYDIIYAGDFEPKTDFMDTYVRRKLPLAYVKTTDVLPVGTPITIRTLEGDIDLKVEKDLYIMIGLNGDVYTSRKKRFDESYITLENDDSAKELLSKTEGYVPVIKNRADGMDMSLADYARTCIPAEDIYIYACPLEQYVKVFTIWDKTKYIMGKPGDYLVVRCNNKKDIYVLEKDLFEKSYNPVAPESIQAC